MSDVQSEQTQSTQPQPAVIPAEPQLPQTKFEGVSVTVERDPNAALGSGRWLVYVEPVPGVRWVLAERKLGGLDDDLQEAATPGFKEAKAVRYARESGRVRLEAGPGAQ